MDQNNSLGLSQIGQIAVNVKDLNRAIEFYREKLGMKHLFNAGTMSFFDCAGIRLMLAQPEKPEFDHPSSIIYFKVPKAVEMYETLSARGVAFEAKPHLVARMPTHDLWMGFFRDSENNLLGIMSEEPRTSGS
jgi:catechol 2,3-dioxygenase-like lactoylglutathione lyase family enzyme